MCTTACKHLQWGTADAEIKKPPDGSSGLSKVPSLFLSLEDEYSLAQHALPTARASGLLISTFPVHSMPVSPKPLQRKTTVWNCENTLTYD